MIDLTGKTVLILGGAGLVGQAVSRQLIELGPSHLVIAARRRERAEKAAGRLVDEQPGTPARVVPLWGDVFLRVDESGESPSTRTAALANAQKRRRLVADILEPMDDEILASSRLARMIMGDLPSHDCGPADVIIDCINTATAVSYQNIYSLAQDLAKRTAREAADLTVDIETLLGSLYIPQLVRHVQLMHEAMRRAGTLAYIKVGTTGTGGMGLNIPYTHGEEKPSRLLLSKTAIAGAQSQLIFLMARTPDAPMIVREVKPAAVIGWRNIAYGPVRSGGREIPLYDCKPDEAVTVDDGSNLAADGDFGSATGKAMEGVYIDTGENGLFSLAEFTAITALGQMQMVTPEDIARTVIGELTGRSTGKDIVSALDGAVLDPSYRGGFLRQSAVNHLSRLESKHGEAIAFEILGPPRLSKLLFEASLLRHTCGTISNILAQDADALARGLEQRIAADQALRTHMISIGIPVLAV